MSTFVFIGLFNGPHCNLYRDPLGRVPLFDSHPQASQYILDHDLGKTASAIEVSDYWLPTELTDDA